MLCCLAHIVHLAMGYLCPWHGDMYSSSWVLQVCSERCTMWKKEGMVSIEKEIVALAEATYGNARYGKTDVIVADAKEWEYLITSMLLPIRKCVEAWGKIISQPDWFENAIENRRVFESSLPPESWDAVVEWDAIVEAVGGTQTALVCLRGGKDED